jgi:flavorubredoxin
MATVTEIAPDVFRICAFVPEFNLQFNHFLVKDDEPLLFHTGMRRMFPLVRDAVARVLDPASLRWIAFSHFEVDECGALNEWLETAPAAQAACSEVGAIVNLGDFADRPPRALKSDEPFETGRHRFRFRPTPHLPHGWDAGVLFDETTGTLFCSDLFHQAGDVEPLTESDVIGRTRAAMAAYRGGPLMDYLPYTPYTGRLLRELAELNPRTLAAMHGSSFTGDCAKAIEDLAVVLKEEFGART